MIVTIYFPPPSSSSLSSSHSLPSFHPCPSTNGRNMSIYVKMHASIYTNIRIYVRTSNSAYTNTLTFKAHKLMHTYKQINPPFSNEKSAILIGLFLGRGNLHSVWWIRNAWNPGSQTNLCNIYIYIHIYIIIIMSRHQQGYPWPSPATPLYRLSLLAGRQGYIPYRHRAVVCRFYLVVMPLSMWRGLQEFVPTSPAVSRMFGSSNLNSFRDWW